MALYIVLVVIRWVSYTIDPSIVKRASPEAVEWDKSINLNNVEVAEISVGAHHTLLRDTMGIVYSCGWSGFNGRLGTQPQKGLIALKKLRCIEKMH